MITIIAVSLLFALLAAPGHGHGSMILPPQRGVSSKFKFWMIPVYEKGDTTDFLAHFPVGNKAAFPGAGKQSQKKAAGSQGWSVYDPTRPGFKFRAGPCGDPIGQNPGEHTKGGRFYNGGKIHKTYTQGGTISFDVVIVGHHNGYMEFRVCDAKQCGGDITNNCLRDGNKCRLLKRASVTSCESRNDQKCGPIDPKYPSRWYLPCSMGDNDFYGNGKIKYKLPSDFSCDHCVVQWYHTTANSCNPAGLLPYFMGPRSPKWGKCKGQGDAVGGYRPFPALCQGNMAGEDYLQCADIKITPKNGSSSSSGNQSNQGINDNQSNQGSSSNQNDQENSSNGGGSTGGSGASNSGSSGESADPIKYIELYADGKGRIKAYNGDKVTLDMKKYKVITFIVPTTKKQKYLQFFINGSKKWTEYGAPYVFQGNKKQKSYYWKKNVIYNKWFKLEVKVPKNSMKIEVFLKK